MYKKLHIKTNIKLITNMRHRHKQTLNDYFPLNNSLIVISLISLCPFSIKTKLS